MKGFLLTISFILISIFGFSQTIEFGPLAQYHRTVFKSKGETTKEYSQTMGQVVNSTEINITESAENYAYGLYAAYYTEKSLSYSIDLFYVTTSSPNYGNVKFKSINLIPNVGIELGNSNIHFSVGFGAGFILNKPSFENVKDVESRKYKAIDGLAQMAFHYRIKKVLTFDGGALYGVNNIVDKHSRIHFYIGARVPVNLFFK